MPKTRYIEEYTNGVLTARVPCEVSDEQLATEALAQEFNDMHVSSLDALKHWSQLTDQQKFQILKRIVRWSLWKDGWFPPPDDGG